MWAFYSHAPYPIRQPPIRYRPIYSAGASSGVRATIDNWFAVIYKKYHEEAKIEKCLIKLTYELLEPTYTADLQERMLIYPAPTFYQFFNMMVQMWGASTPTLQLNNMNVLTQP